MTNDEWEEQTDAHFGEWLKAKRQSQFLKTGQLAYRAGIRPNRIHSLELGHPKKGVSFKECCGIANALSMPLEAVLCVAKGAL